MKAQSVDVKQAAGKILCSTVFRACGKKLLAKGRLIREEDVELLRAEGMTQVWVTELEEGEIGEDEAALRIAAEVGCGSLEIRPAPGGKANLVAAENCCVLVDEELLRQINCITGAAVATLANFTFAAAGQRVASVKSAPFAVPLQDLEAVLSVLRERGPLLQARPIRNPVVAVLYSDPISADKARQLFDSVMRQRLERFGASVSLSLASTEQPRALARALEHLLRARPTVVLVASTTAPAGPSDAVGWAMVEAGCQIERFMAPVEPGSLLLLGYKDDIPVVAAPGCWRSTKPNVLDLVLCPLLARYRLSGWEIAGLGHGGLLE
jgi:molybdenum cofactor cytidylyltransferase